MTSAVKIAGQNQRHLIFLAKYHDWLYQSFRKIFINNINLKICINRLAHKLCKTGQVCNCRSVIKPCWEDGMYELTWLYIAAYSICSWLSTKLENINIDLYFLYQKQPHLLKPELLLLSFMPSGSSGRQKTLLQSLIKNDCSISSPDLNLLKASLQPLWRPLMLLWQAQTGVKWINIVSYIS